MRSTYDRELAEVVPGLPKLDLGAVEEMRALMTPTSDQMAAMTAPDSVTVDDHRVATPEGHDVLVHAVTPRSASHGPRPCFLWFHGGGFVAGKARTDVLLCATFAEATGATVVSVDYRLAPEHPYPAGVNDGFAVLNWVHLNAERLGIDTSRIGIGGTSAGACIAASIALLTRDRQGPQLCCQLLDMPVIDNELSSASMQIFTDTPMWTRRNAEDSWRLYLGDRDVTAPVEPYASPARADTLAELPPAYVAVCEFDPLRDEGIDYARRLTWAGVPTELHQRPGTFHGSTYIHPSADVSRQMMGDQVKFLVRALTRI